MNQFPIALMILGQGAHGFYPIPRIEIMDAIDHSVFGFMDMAADDSVAAFGFGHFGQFGFVIVDVGDRFFYFSLDILREGIVRKSGFEPVVIHDSVEPKQKSVAYVAEKCNPSEVCGNAVENIPVSDEVFFAIGLIGHVFEQLESADLKWEDLIQKVIVIASEVVDMGLMVFYQFEDSVEKTGVFPLPAARLFELPAVDDIAVKDEVFAAKLLQKPGNFFCF